jgi:hypothetical protein
MTSVVTFGDHSFNNLSLTNPLLFGDGGDDISTQDVSPEDLLLLVGLPGISDIRMITALPIDECQRINTLNSSLWT